MTIMEASIEEKIYTMRLGERLQLRMRWCVYGLRILTKTTEASVEDEGYVTRLRNQRQQMRRWGLDHWTKESKTTTEVSEEEDEEKDNNNNNRCVDGR